MDGIIRQGIEFQQQLQNKTMKYFKCYLLLGGLMVTLLTSCYTKEQRMKKQRETWIRRAKEFRENDSLYKLEHGIKDTVHRRIETMRP